MRQRLLDLLDECRDVFRCGGRWVWPSFHPICLVGFFVAAFDHRLSAGIDAGQHVAAGLGFRFIWLACLAVCSPSLTSGGPGSMMAVSALRTAGVSDIPSLALGFLLFRVVSALLECFHKRERVEFDALFRSNNF